MSINPLNFALAKKDWDKAYDDLSQLEIGGRNLILTPYVVDGQSYTAVYVDDMNSEDLVLSMWDDAHKNTITEISLEINYKEIPPQTDLVSVGDLPYFISGDDEIEYIMIVIQGLNFDHFFESKFKLEEGNKATEWTPAPQDINAHPFVVKIAELAYEVNNKLIT